MVDLRTLTHEVTMKSDMDVELIDWMGSDAAIVAAARVSTAGDKVDYITENFGEIGLVSDKDRGLVNFLMRDRHGTPFEHNSITFRISAPLFVFYEFHRHRVGWSYNEESARYRQLDPVFYSPREERALRQVGKPGAYTFEPGSYAQVRMTAGSHYRIAMEAWSEYLWLLDHDVAREVARNVLPVSIYKTMYATCNLRSLFSFLSLRWAHPLSTVPTFPLAEIQDVAQQMDELAREVFPVAFEAFDKNGRVSP